MRTVLTALVLSIGMPILGLAQNPAPDKPRPIPIRDSVFIEDLTWMEVRDLIAEGKDTAIVASGGIEQNGPYLVTGKHNVLLRGTTEAIARDLGNALVAPILKLVPEGDFDPPTEMMRFPGTIGLSQETFRAVLRDVARSLRASGFQHIIFLGDSGGNQAGMTAVAEEMHAEWNGSPVSISFPSSTTSGASGPGSPITASRRSRRAFTTNSRWRDDGGGGSELHPDLGAPASRTLPDQRSGPRPAGRDPRLGHAPLPAPLGSDGEGHPRRDRRPHDELGGPQAGRVAGRLRTFCW